MYKKQIKRGKNQNKKNMKHVYKKRTVRVCRERVLRSKRKK